MGTRTEQCHNRRTFKKSLTQITGVVPLKRAFNARYDDKGKRYDLGNFDTLEEASKARDIFIELFKTNNPKASEMLSKGNSDRRLRLDSSIGIKGITGNDNDGYIIRKFLNGKRRYLGHRMTLEAAIELLGRF